MHLLVITPGWGREMPRPRKPASPFRYFNSSPEVIRLVVLMYVRFPLSLRNVEDLLFERGIDICHETVLGSGLVAHSQKMTVAARAMAEKKAVGQRS
jgi:transposase-like protein